MKKDDDKVKSKMVKAKEKIKIYKLWYQFKHRYDEYFFQTLPKTV